MFAPRASEPEAVHGSGLGEETSEDDQQIREHSTDTGEATDQLLAGFRMIKYSFQTALPQHAEAEVRLHRLIEAVQTYREPDGVANQHSTHQGQLARRSARERVFCEGAVLPSLIFRRFYAYRQGERCDSYHKHQSFERQENAYFLDRGHQGTNGSTMPRGYVRTKERSACR